MDDLYNKIKESKDRIEESKINNPDEIYSKAFKNKNKENKTIFNRTMILRLVSCLALVFIVLVSFVSINETNKQESEEGLVTFSSKKEIERLIKRSFSNSNGFLDGIFDSTNGTDIEEALPEKNESTSDKEYETNNQVEGVDEADRIKVNGDYIYYVTIKTYKRDYESKQTVDMSEKCLYILKTIGDDIEIVKEITFNDTEKLISSDNKELIYEITNYNPIDMFYTDKYIILNVSMTTYAQITYLDDGKTETSNYRRFASYFIYDINTYEIVKKVSIPGNVMTSRLIDNELYIISNYSVNLDNNYIIPEYAIDDVYYEPELNEIFYCPSIDNVSQYTNIFKITLGNTIELEKTYYLSSYIYVIYVSKEAIYLCYANESIIEKNLNIETTWPCTKIICFNIKDSITYDGFIEVKGRVNDKYWIDEYDGYLRVATTGTKYSSKTSNNIYRYGHESEVFNYLTIFAKSSESKWEMVSQINEGLGEIGESIKSVRFNGNVATIVTFRQTDPLYYIDLTDPKNPVITSELKISGFTVYQHPYKDNYVIGIGYEADSNGRTTGYKVALFDISNQFDIKEVGNPIVFSYYEYGYYLPVLNNPKTLFLDLDNDIFGFSIPKYDNSGNRDDDFILFKINLDSDNPLSIIYEENNLYLNGNINYYLSFYYTSYHNRMVYIDDKYYLLTLNSVYVYKLNNDNIELLSEKPLLW